MLLKNFLLLSSSLTELVMLVYNMLCMCSAYCQGCYDVDDTSHKSQNLSIKF